MIRYREDADDKRLWQTRQMRDRPGVADTAMDIPFSITAIVAILGSFLGEGFAEQGPSNRLSAGGLM